MNRINGPVSATYHAEVGTNRTWRRLVPAVVAAGLLGGALFASGAPITSTTSAADTTAESGGRLGGPDVL